MKRIFALFFAMLMCTSAHSESYFGASIQRFSMSFTDGYDSAEVNMNSISGVYGEDLGDNLSAEFRFGFGVTSYKEYYDSYDYYELELDHYYGAYLKYSVSEGDITPYIVGGLTKGKLTLKDSWDGYTYSDSQDDFSLGFGLDFSNGWNLEYMQYIDKNGADFGGLSVGKKF